MRYILITFFVGYLSFVNAQQAEHISLNGVSYFDPEINNPYNLMTYQKSNGEIWIAGLDSITGRFNNDFGDDVKVGEDAAALSVTFNGPEFGYDSTEWRIFYTKTVEGTNQVWQIREEGGNYTSSLVGGGSQPRQSVLASKNPASGSIRVIYSVGGFNGIMVWKDLDSPETETSIDSVDRGIRWIDNTNSVAYVKQTGPSAGEIAIYNTDDRSEIIASSDGRPKSNVYGWIAPDYGNQVVVTCLIDNDKKIAFYREIDGKWENFLELSVPEESAYEYFGSPEAFVAAGKSHISCVTKEVENAYSKSEVWVLSLGATIGRETKVEGMMKDGLGEIIRTDPESFVADNEVFIYYNVINNDNEFEVYRVRTNIETLQEPHLTSHIIYPRETDPSINGNPEPHYTLIDQNAEALGKLLLYFPGTRARPVDYLKFSKTAAELGYHAISLSYENLFDINYTACGETSDFTCHGRARTEIWTGEDTHDLLKVSSANSILNRLNKLFEYLVSNYPEENWQQFYSDNTILWEKIAVAGHSQGGGHAGFASKLYEVNRSIMIAASDWVLNTTSQWIRNPGPTPDDRYYGFIHELDTPASSIIVPTWEDYGILKYGDPVVFEESSPPFDYVHAIFSDTPLPNEKTRAHNFVIVDFLTPNSEDFTGYYYSDVWEYLLTNETSLTSIDNPKIRNLEMFPNPTKNILNLNSESGCELFDITGKHLKTYEGYVEQIDVSELAPGLYFLKAGSKTGRFIKE